MTVETLPIDHPDFQKINRDDLSNWAEALAEFKAKPPRHRGHPMPYVVFGMVSLSHKRLSPPEAHEAYARRVGKAVTELLPEEKTEAMKSVTYRKTGRCSLNVLNCFNTHGTIQKIDQLHREGQKLLDYWFPDKSHLPRKRADVESGWIAKLRDSEDDPFDDVRRHCEMLKNGDQVFSGIQKERDALQARVVELQRELGKKNVDKNQQEIRTESKKD